MNIENIRRGIKNSLKWSLYRHKIFKECNRKFMFKYLDFLILKEQKFLVTLLKKVKKLRHFQGDLVHLFIRIIINNYINNISLNFEDLKDKFRTQFWNNINNSKNFNLETLTNSNLNLKNISDSILYRNNYIWEFLYEYSISNKELEDILNQSLTALINFWNYFNSNILPILKDFEILWLDSGLISNKSNKNSYNIIEYNLIFHNELQKFSENKKKQNEKNILILLNPDFVIINKSEKQVYIYDWKTHKKEDIDLNQFYLYTLYYNNLYKDFKISNFMVYLFPELQEEILSLTINKEFIEFIIKSYTQIKNTIKRAYLELKEQIDDNQGMLKEDFLYKFYSYFTMTNDLSVCSFCEFRKICFDL